MISIFLTLLYLLFLGYPYLLLFCKVFRLKKGFWERLFLGFIFGTLTFSILAFLLCASIMRLDNWLLFVVSLPSLAIWVWHIAKKAFRNGDNKGSEPGLLDESPLHPKEITSRKILKYFIIILLLTTVFYSIFISRHTPLSPNDEISIWGYRARLFYLGGDIPKEYFTTHKHFRHADHPLHLSLLHSLVPMLMGAWDETSIKVINRLYYIFLGVGIYALFRRMVPGYLAALFSLLACWLPMIFVFSYGAMCDEVAATLELFMFIYFALWLMNDRSHDLFLSGIFLMGAYWTKRDTVMVLACIIMVLVLELYRRKESIIQTLRKITFFLFPLVPIFLIWGYFSRKYNLVAVDTKIFPLDSARLSEVFIRLPVVIEWMARELFLTLHFSTIWFTLILLLLMIDLRQVKWLVPLLVYIFLRIMLLTLPYLFATVEVDLLMSGSIFRITMGASLVALATVYLITTRLLGYDNDSIKSE